MYKYIGSIDHSNRRYSTNRNYLNSQFSVGPQHSGWSPSLHHVDVVDTRELMLNQMSIMTPAVNHVYQLSIINHVGPLSIVCIFRQSYHLSIMCSICQLPVSSVNHIICQSWVSPVSYLYHLSITCVICQSCVPAVSHLYIPSIISSVNHVYQLSATYIICPSCVPSVNHAHRLSIMRSPTLPMRRWVVECPQ